MGRSPMRPHPGSVSVVVLLLCAALSLPPQAHCSGDFHVGSSRGTDSSTSSSSSPDSSSRSSSSSSSRGAGEHHPTITVTGVDVGTAAAGPTVPSASGAADPSASPTAAAAASAETPNLIGDLISAASGGSNGSIADVLDKALAKEFAQESKNAESGKGKTFNETVASEEAKVETVVRISAGHPVEKKEEEQKASSSDGGSSSSGTAGTPGSSSSSAAGATTSTSSSGGGKNGTSSSGSGSTAEKEKEKEVPSVEKGVDRIIDSQDNEFVLSAPPKDQMATLTLDPLLIQDLTFLFASAALMGIVFESLGQPVINGYLVAGAIVGPGGLQLIKELVQVESLAQLGVQLLLFHLGRELSFSKLKAVWSVALVGGALQIVALSALGGVVAAVMESPVTQGIFVGALLSMSSTSVVVKCLESYRMNGTAFGQITIGTLILQDCSVGIMFALMPAFGAAAAGQAASSTAAGAAAAAAGGASSSHGALLQVAVLVCTVMVKLLLLVAASLAVARLVLPRLLQLLMRYASGELVQLSLVSLCLCSAWLCGRLGLSEELGAFIAGAMMAIAEQRLVAAGHMLPSAPHSPGSKGHLSEPESPTAVPAAVLGKPPAPKHNSAAVAYYRHATQRQGVQQQHQPQRASFHDTEAGDVIPAVHDVDSNSLTAQLHDLHQQQQQALLAGESPPHSRSQTNISDGIIPGSNRSGSTHTLGGSGGGGGGNGAAGSGDSHGPSVCANIESIQNVLTALFVASMGLIMSPVFLWHHASVLLCGTLLVTLLKAAVVTLVVRMFDVPMRLSLAVGLSMAHIGEFSFVLLSMANQLKLLSSQVYMLLLGVTAMSLLTTPLVIMTSIHFLAKDGHPPVLLNIAGPRLRLSVDRE